MKRFKLTGSVIAGVIAVVVGGGAAVALNVETPPAPVATVSPAPTVTPAPTVAPVEKVAPVKKVAAPAPAPVEQESAVTEPAPEPAPVEAEPVEVAPAPETAPEPEQAPEPESAPDPEPVEDSGEVVFEKGIPGPIFDLPAPAKGAQNAPPPPAN
jgi:hypothetical protein